VLWYFSLFKQAAISLSLLPCTVSYSKQATVFSFPHLLLLPFQFYPLLRGQLFSWFISISTLCYIKLLVTNSKQFSIELILFLIGKVIYENFAYSTHSLLLTHFRLYQFCLPGLATWISEVHSKNLVWRLSLNSRNRWCFINFFPWPRVLEMQPMPTFTSQICQFCPPDLAPWISKVDSWNCVRSHFLDWGKDCAS